MFNLKRVTKLEKEIFTLLEKLMVKNDILIEKNNRILELEKSLPKKDKIIIDIEVDTEKAVMQIKSLTAEIERLTEINREQKAYRMLDDISKTACEIINECNEIELKCKKCNIVYILQHKQTMRIHGCFSTKEKAEKYANNSPNIQIMKLKVE